LTCSSAASRLIIRGLLLVGHSAPPL
jgi:hypothetical protein